MNKLSLSESGRRAAERQWSEARARLQEEVGARPQPPVGYPPLRKLVTTRLGQKIDVSEPLWRIDADDSGRRVRTVNVDRLFRPWADSTVDTRGKLSGIPRRESVLSGELIHMMVLFLILLVERKSAGTVSTALQEFAQFEEYLSQNEWKNFGPEEFTKGVYEPFSLMFPQFNGKLRRFYRWCVGQGFPGFSYYEGLRISSIATAGKANGVPIRSRDPVRGALTWEESQLLSHALRNPKADTDPYDRLITWLFYELGVRPAAIGSLCNGAIKRAPLGERYSIDIPRVKQKTPTKETFRRSISPELGELALALRRGGDTDLLIPDLGKGWAVKACRAFVATNDLRTIRVCASDEDGSETPGVLPLTPYRLRYTMGTTLAEEGASPEQIAAMLDDRSIAMALVYTNNTSAIVDILAETLDRHPSWLRVMNLFTGSIRSPADSERMLPVIQGGVPYLSNFDNHVEKIGQIGWCSSSAECTLRPPLACYRCSWFLADPDPAVHLAQMTQLTDDIRSQVGVESDRMAAVFKPDLFAISEVATITRGGRTLNQDVESRIAREEAAT